MNSLFLAGMLFASLQASTPTLEVATGDWSNIPLLQNRNYTNIISQQALERVHKLLQKDDCVIPGQSSKRLDLTVPFLVHYSPEGRINRLVLRKLGCTEVERVLGSVLLTLAEKDQYRPTGANSEGWYRGELSLTSS